VPSPPPPSLPGVHLLQQDWGKSRLGQTPFYLSFQRLQLFLSLSLLLYKWPGLDDFCVVGIATLPLLRGQGMARERGGARVEGSGGGMGECKGVFPFAHYDGGCDARYG
jgi:hypothetical protein